MTTPQAPAPGNAPANVGRLTIRRHLGQSVVIAYADGRRIEVALVGIGPENTALRPRHGLNHHPTPAYARLDVTIDMETGDETRREQHVLGVDNTLDCGRDTVIRLTAIDTWNTVGLTVMAPPTVPILRSEIVDSRNAARPAKGAHA